MITGLFPDLLPRGGVQRAGLHIGAVVAALAERRAVPYQLLTLNDPALTHPLSIGERQFEARGSGGSKARFTLAALRLALRRPRLVVVGHPHLSPVAAAMKAIAPGLKILAVCHGAEVWEPLPLSRRVALRFADVVMAPSGDTVRRLVAVQGLPAAKVHRVPWGLDPRFTATAEAFAASASLPAGPGGASEPTVLTVGRLVAAEPGKGIDQLIRAFPAVRSAVPGAQLVVIGDGDDLPRLKRLAGELNVRDCVRFLSEVPQDLLFRSFQQCRVFAMPSRQEGFGLVFLEAMALGKPVIGGAHGGTPDVIEDGVSGLLVPHGDVGRLTAALVRLLTDGSLRETLSRQALRSVERTYRFEHFAARFTRLLEATLDEVALT